MSRVMGADRERSGMSPRADYQTPLQLAVRARIRNAIRRETTLTVEPDSGCIVWMAARNDQGYGVVSLGKRRVYAHRLVAALKYGGIAEGLQVDHLCRNRACYNPDHIELVTPKENSQRGLRGRLITSCKRGHPLDGMTKPGHRYCRTCARERKRKQASE